MDELQNQLVLLNKELEEAILYAESILKNAPKGNLRIARNKNSEQYYVRDINEHAYGTYIKKANMELVHALAQKDYAQRLHKLAKKEQESIQMIFNSYIPNGIKEIYRALEPRRQRLVKPYILPDDMFVTQWQNITFEKNQNYETDYCITTERGEIVKSKSEKILADKFHLMDIPYHYEKPLFLKGYGIVHPDFFILNRRTRKEFYWEHLGLMDKPDYCEKAIKKIELMQRNGIYLGEKLIVTFETLKHPLNMKIVEDTIEKYLL